MRSFISSSRFRSAVDGKLTLFRATVLLFWIAIGVYGSLEGASRIGLGRLSKIHRRILHDREMARKIRPDLSGNRKTILFVGNSLLLEGVDNSQLATEVKSRFQTFQYAVESTAYHDWEFGIRQLFRHGSKPDYLVLCLSPGQLRSDALRGDFDAKFLFDFQDIWPASRAIHADLTTTASFYFANLSAFYAARVELRNVLMGKIGLESVQRVWHDLATVPLVETPEDHRPLYTSRLETIADICRSRGVQLLFLIPPTAQPGDLDVVQAGKVALVPVIHPVPNYSLGEEYYRDTFHLNSRGARIFTGGIAKSLLSMPLS